MNELQISVEKLKEKINSSFFKSIDVDEGWYQIIVDCDNELVLIDPCYSILQIKEKFGGLRFYISPSSDIAPEQRGAMYKVISKYEAIAAITCEATGLPGVLMESPSKWKKTLNAEYAQSTTHFAKYSVIQNCLPKNT